MPNIGDISVTWTEIVTYQGTISSDTLSRNDWEDIHNEMVNGNPKVLHTDMDSDEVMFYDDTGKLIRVGDNYIDEEEQNKGEHNA